jgi:hypothetical protein
MAACAQPVPDLRRAAPTLPRAGAWRAKLRMLAKQFY